MVGFEHELPGEVPWSLLRQPLKTAVLPVEVPDGNGELPVFTQALRPRSTIILNTGREHLALLGSMQAVIAEFADLLAALPEGGTAILNGDDPHLRHLPTAARRITFGEGPDCDISIVEAHRDAGRLVVTVDVEGERHTASTLLVGLHYKHAVAASIAFGLMIGVPPARAAQRLATLPATPMRLEPFTSVRGATILSDDYKATPETVLAGLEELGHWPGQVRWAVLGELTNLPPGDPAPEYAAIAATCVGRVDRVVTIGPEWKLYEGVWRGLGIDVAHADSVHDAADPVMADHGPEDVIYVKACEDVRARRITLRLTGLPVTCRRDECKLTLVRCENCPRVV